MISRETHDRMANAIRFLAMDAVEKANSGHPGLPMGAADVATVLFTRYLNMYPTMLKASCQPIGLDAGSAALHDGSKVVPIIAKPAPAQQQQQFQRLPPAGQVVPLPAPH